LPHKLTFSGNEGEAHLRLTLTRFTVLLLRGKASLSQHQPGLECLRRIQQNRHRAFVHQFYCHHFLEATSLAAQARCAAALDE